MSRDPNGTTTTTRGPHVFKRQWKDPKTGMVKESPWYYLCYFAPGPNGRKRRVIKRTDPPTESKRAAVEQLRAALGGMPLTTARNVHVEEILEMYAEHLKASSPSTWKRCGSRVRWWESRYGTWTHDQLTQVEVERAASELREAHTDSTVYGFLALLKAAFRLAVKQGVIESSPLEHLTISRRRTIRTAVWLDDEISLLCQHLPSWAVPLVRFLRETGIRISDALNLRWEDFQGDVMRKVQQKTGEELHVPLSEAAQEILRSIPRSGDLVFPGLRGQPMGHRNVLRAFHRSMARAGLTGRTIHDLRRTFASELSSTGSPDRQIAALLGQQTTSVVGRYAHPELDALRRSLERARNKKSDTRPPHKEESTE